MSIPVSNILQPGAISLSTGANRQLLSDLQILKPQFWNMYVEKYGNEEFFQWLATYAGMEEVKDQTFFWFQNRGKLMIGLTPAADVSANVAGGSITVTLSAGDHYNSGTQSPLRQGESFRVASTNVEGEILSIDTSTPSAFTFVARPKQSTQKLASAGSTSLLATDVLLLAGQIDAGEASTSINPQIQLDEKKTGYISTMRESWKATDWAEMAEVYYNSGVSGSAPAGGNQSGTSYFTYKGLVKTNQRYLNHIENKLLRGDLVTNTGMYGTSEVGTKGLIPSISADGQTVTYSAGTLDIAKLHEITRIMDVNGCAKENLWLMDIYQRQNFSDGIFKEFPAGAWVWGKNDQSEEAAIAYGVQSILIDGYLFKAKKYKYFNTEATTGKAPATDAFRNYGAICPQGVSQSYTKDPENGVTNIKNLSIMFQAPQKGGTVGNGIRVWQHGGGSMNPTNGQLVDQVEMVTYRGLRVAAGNQFLQVQAG